MSQDEIYERLLGWMDARLKENENTSRVVFSDKEKGQIVGIGDEWIVFSSTALSLDRTKNPLPADCDLPTRKERARSRKDTV